MAIKRTEEQIRDILKLIISLVRKGCPSGGRNGFISNLPPNEANPNSLVDVYKWFTLNPDLRAEYRKARRIGADKRMATANRIGMRTKRAYMAKIIEYVAQGYSIRGKQSALDAAAYDLGISAVHWQTFWVWLRYQMPEFQDDYRAAFELKKSRTRARRKLEN